MTRVAKMILGGLACEANGLRDNNYKKKIKIRSGTVSVGDRQRGR
jgi:hypothetical protein